MKFFVVGPPNESLKLSEKLLIPLLKEKDKKTVFTTHFDNYENFIDRNKKYLNRYFMFVSQNEKKEFLKKYKLLPYNDEFKKLDWWFSKDEKSEEMRNQYVESIVEKDTK